MSIASYRLLELVGKGGMGEVFRCSRVDGEILAIKVMSSDLVSNEVMLKRFERECALAMRLSHPNIVRGVEFGVDQGRPYLVMEYVDGKTLTALVRERGPLPEHAVVRLAGQIAAALDMAHGEGLIHRDVKPDNILINAAGDAKLADLGLAKDLNVEVALTRPGSHLGTMAYMAPEQYGEADTVDARCDVYGLAATLYYALTGRPPFPDKRNLTALEKKLCNDFPAPRALVPTVSECVNAALCLALDAKPELRPVRCGELVDMMRVGMNDGPPHPVEIVRPGGSWQDRRSAKRFPTQMEAVCSPTEGDDAACEATVADVSLTGVLLESQQRFEPSSVLRVQVRDEETGEGPAFIVRVCWARQAGGQWALGCAFDRALLESELSVFLKNKTSTRFL
jgi:serine/threonine protein kinase